MVKGWGWCLRDQGLIPYADSHFRCGCGVPVILARSLRNGTSKMEVSQCVCTPHTQSKDPSASLQRVVADFGGGHGYWARFEYYGLQITLSALKTWHDIEGRIQFSISSWQYFPYLHVYTHYYNRYYLILSVPWRKYHPTTAAYTTPATAQKHNIWCLVKHSVMKCIT